MQSVAFNSRKKHVQSKAPTAMRGFDRLTETDSGLFQFILTTDASYVRQNPDWYLRTVQN